MHIIHTRRGKLIQFFLKGNDEMGLILLLQHFTGMNRESDDYRRQSNCFAPGVHLLDQVTMALVYTVEKTDGSNDA
jgi:hypothetical protein